MPVQSTQVGYRIRGIEPPDLATQPDRVKLMYWGWIVELGLKAKDAELARGLDKDGAKLRPLKPESIKHRKSEVGPTHKTAPPLEPALKRSRVRSLLTGRAHTTSAEFWWEFDAVSGRSFAEILIAQRDAYGRDVFGLSPAGVASIRATALSRWNAWKARGAPAPPPARTPTGQLVKTPVRKIKVTGRTDLENATLGAHADEARTRASIDAGLHTGFRRLNAQGEKWTPPNGAIGYVKPPRKPPAPQPPRLRQPGQGTPAAPPLPTFGASPARVVIDPDSKRSILKSIRQVIGPNATAQDAATLAGAPAGTTASIWTNYGNVIVTVKGEGISMIRELERPAGAPLKIHDVELFIAKEKQRHGLGTEIMGRQVEAATKAGASHFYMTALRNDFIGSSGTTGVGYKVWPKFGYDAPLPLETIANLPPELAGATRVSDLYATAAGRAWWEQYGETLDMRFDLTPGSYSLQVWEAYLRARQAR